MFSRYKQRCFIKILFARGKNVSQCFRGLQEACGRDVLPYRTIARRMEDFCQGREEYQHRAHTGRPVAATDDLHVQAVRVLLEEDRRWTCVEISKEFGIATSTVHANLRKEHLCSYLQNIFLGRYYLLNVRNSERIHKILLFQTWVARQVT